MASAVAVTAAILVLASLQPTAALTTKLSSSTRFDPVKDFDKKCTASTYFVKQCGNTKCRTNSDSPCQVEKALSELDLTYPVEGLSVDQSAYIRNLFPACKFSAPFFSEDGFHNNDEINGCVNEALRRGHNMTADDWGLELAPTYCLRLKGAEQVDCFVRMLNELNPLFLGLLESEPSCKYEFLIRGVADVLRQSGSSQVHVTTTISNLHKEFTKSGMGPFEHFLGVDNADLTQAPKWYQYSDFEGYKMTYYRQEYLDEYYANEDYYVKYAGDPDEPMTLQATPNTRQMNAHAVRQKSKESEIKKGRDIVRTRDLLASFEERCLSELDEQVKEAFQKVKFPPLELTAQFNSRGKLQASKQIEECRLGVPNRIYSLVSEINRKSHQFINERIGMAQTHYLPRPFLRVMRGLKALNAIVDLLTGMKSILYEPDYYISVLLKTAEKRRQLGVKEDKAAVDKTKAIIRTLLPDSSSDDLEVKARQLSNVLRGHHSNSDADDDESVERLRDSVSEAYSPPQVHGDIELRYATVGDDAVCLSAIEALVKTMNMVVGNIKTEKTTRTAVNSRAQNGIAAKLIKRGGKLLEKIPIVGEAVTIIKEVAGAIIDIAKNAEENLAIVVDHLADFLTQLFVNVDAIIAAVKTALDSTSDTSLSVLRQNACFVLRMFCKNPTQDRICKNAAIRLKNFFPQSSPFFCRQYEEELDIGQSSPDSNGGTSVTDALANILGKKSRVESGTDMAYEGGQRVIEVVNHFG